MGLFMANYSASLSFNIPHTLVEANMVVSDCDATVKVSHGEDVGTGEFSCDATVKEDTHDGLVSCEDAKRPRKPWEDTQVDDS